MIKFFRTIRQNLLMENPSDKSSRAGKTGKYFKYAIGEIILVVIGILIALQINNWNEERKEVLHQKGILTNLVEDLRADSASFHENYRKLSEVEAVHHQLYDVIAQKSNGDSLENPQIIRRLGWAYYRLGQYDESLKYLRFAFEKLKDAEIAAHLGEVLWVAGEREAAQDIWNSALQQAPNDDLLLNVMQKFTE